MAYKAVEAMVQHLSGEEVEEVIDSGYTIVTAETAQEHIDKLKSYSEKWSEAFPFRIYIAMNTE